MKFAIGCKASELLFEFFSSLFLFGDLVCCDILLLLLNQPFIAVISTVHPLCMQLVKYPLQGIILLLVNFSFNLLNHLAVFTCSLKAYTTLGVFYVAGIENRLCRIVTGLYALRILFIEVVDQGRLHVLYLRDIPVIVNSLIFF